MRDDVRKNLDEQRVKPTAREILLPLFEAKPLLERFEPLFPELLWVLLGLQNPQEHKFILPAYCYNIFERAARTVFQAFPLLQDTVFCPDPSKLVGVATVDEAKKHVRLDWYRLGKMTGVLLRMSRFINLEMERQVKQDGMWELEPAKERDIVTMLGAEWLEKKGLQLSGGAAENLPCTIIDAFKGALPQDDFQQKWSRVAYEWGTDAMSEFNRGIAHGIPGFITDSGELAGETRATNNYMFFLVLWPEIKAKLEQNPLPNRTEVFEWVSQFHDAGLIYMPNIDYFRDFCESIGLKFAGRTPKKS